MDKIVNFKICEQDAEKRIESNFQERQSTGTIVVPEATDGPWINGRDTLRSTISSIPPSEISEPASMSSSLLSSPTLEKIRMTKPVEGSIPTSHGTSILIGLRYLQDTQILLVELLKCVKIPDPGKRLFYLIFYMIHA